MATRAHTVSEFYLKGFVEHSTPPGQTPALWVYDLRKGAAYRQGTRKVSVLPGAYDHPGGLPPGRGTVEDHMARKVEAPAATALRTWLARPVGKRGPVPDEVMRFVAWLAARTVPVMGLYSQWIEDLLRREAMPDLVDDLLLVTSVSMPNGRTRKATSSAELVNLLDYGGHLVFTRERIVELVHIQAWLFQERLFPKKHWSISSAQHGDAFVTSDRPVFWGAWGLEIHAPPAYIENPTVQVIATLTKGTALIGAHGKDAVGPVSTERINALVARHATEWIAGPSKEVVETAALTRGSPG